MLKDLQNEKDSRNIFIDKIGICDYKLPITLKIQDKKYNSICNISSNVALEEASRGAHLSRIIEVLNESLYNKVITLSDFNKIVELTIQKSNTIGASININFDIIIKNITPISKKDSFNTVNLNINNSKINNAINKSLSISMLGTTLCPCSKEISKYGAHNQKCKVIVTLYGEYENIDLNKIISIIENSFSEKVYSTVKREDEKYITEKAYENAKFSEDLIRDLLIEISKIYDDKIVAELVNYESIHEHNVYAKGKLDKPIQLIRK